MCVEDQNTPGGEKVVWRPVGWAFVALNVVALVSLLFAHVDGSNWNLPPPGSTLSLEGERCKCLRALVTQDPKARAICLVFSGNCPFEKKTVQLYDSLRAVFDSMGVRVVTVDGVPKDAPTVSIGPSCHGREGRCVRKLLGVPKRRAALVAIGRRG